jgi:hypothetical protein
MQLALLLLVEFGVVALVGAVLVKLSAFEKVGARLLPKRRLFGWLALTCIGPCVLASLVGSEPGARASSVAMFAFGFLYLCLTWFAPRPQGAWMYAPWFATRRQEDWLWSSMPPGFRGFRRVPLQGGVRYLGGFFLTTALATILGALSR